MGGLSEGGAKARGRPFPAPWVMVASPRALEARRDLNSNLRPGKDCPAFWGRSLGSARLVASGPRGGQGVEIGMLSGCHGDKPRPPPPAARDERAKRPTGTPVQRNQHYYFLEYFYLHHFLCSSITQ